MTTFEHALLGIHGVLAAGLHREQGWRIAALAAVAANSPDWDGIAVLLRNDWFAAAHRVWGHNIFVCVAVGLALGGGDYRFDVTGRIARFFCRHISRRRTEPLPEIQLRRGETHYTSDLVVWLIIGAIAALSHLATDMLFSGTATLGDWPLQLGWPLSSRGFIFPLVRWGDPTATAIFSLGMIALAKWPRYTTHTARCTLVIFVGFLTIRVFNL